MTRPDLSDRAAQVLAHLLANPDHTHTSTRVARALKLTPIGVVSAFRLFVALGWAVRRDDSVYAVALTPLGRHDGPAAVAATKAGTPLSVLDREDPACADLVRAKMGWEPKHKAVA